MENIKTKWIELENTVKHAIEKFEDDTGFFVKYEIELILPKISSTEETLEEMENPRFKVAMENTIFKKLVKEIQNIGGNIKTQKPTDYMLPIYEGGRGLIWIDYPPNIKAHLRKADYSNSGVEFPRENFKQEGWGKYPELLIKVDMDINYVTRLLKYVLSRWQK